MSGLTGNSINQTMKNNSMTEFNRAVREYKLNKNRSDKCAPPSFNRDLLYLSKYADLSTFDPNTPVTQEFFENLSDLFTILEPGSPVLWSCVNVLGTACKSQVVQNALVHTYQFVSHLSQMLGDHLTQDKKIRLLSVLQDLTCGMSKDWFIPNLQHLITTLSNWVMAMESNQIVLLSSGVILNVCVKNTSAQYILYASVNVKNMTKNLFKMTGPKIDFAVAKYAIIFDNMYNVVQSETLGDLLKCTYRIVTDSFVVNDHMDLRQHICFYLNLELKPEDVQRSIATQKTEFSQFIKELLFELDRKSHSTEAAESASLVFRFLSSILSCKVPEIEDMFRLIIKITISWLSVDSVAPHALNLLKTTLTSFGCPSDKNDCEFIMRTLLEFIEHVYITNKSQEAQCNIMVYVIYNHLFDLFKIFLRNEKTRDGILERLKKEYFETMFNSIVNNPLEPNCAPVADAFSNEALDMYVNALSVVSVVEFYSDKWGPLLNLLFNEKTVQTVLGLGLTTGDLKRHTNALEVISRNSTGLSKCVGKVLSELKSELVRSDQKQQQIQPITMNYKLEMLSNRVKLDEILKALVEIKNGGKMKLDTNDIMELYEYRLMISERSEKNLTSYAEAASMRSIKLEQQIALLDSALRRTQQLHLRSESLQEDRRKECGNLEALLNAEKSLRVKLQEDLAQKEVEMSGSKQRIAELVSKHEEVVAERDNAMLNVIPTLRESLIKVEKIGQRKDDTIRTLQAEVHTVKRNLQDSELVLKETEGELRAATAEVQRLTFLITQVNALMTKK